MKYLFLSILGCLFSTVLWGQAIEGPTNVCQNQCYTYRLQPSDVDTSWQITDPDGLDVSFSYIGDSSLIEVCFSKEGSYTLSVDGAGVPGPGLTVFSGTFTDPVLELLSPMGCENPWLLGQNCVPVCYGQEVTIRPRDIVFDTMQWSVFGPAELINSSNNEITLRLDSVEGDVFISYFGTAGDRCLTEGGKCISLIAPPTAQIGSAEFGIIEDSIEVCQGQIVNFENASDAPVISWGLSTGPSGDTEGFRYRFATPGEYELTLSVGFDCSCTDETTIKVRVNPTPIPEIQCVSSVCAGDTALYETQMGCAPYQWRIQGNGTIVNGGGTNDAFMEVSWTGGSEGWVELEHDCADACPLPARERIQILGPDTQISGRTEVCPGQLYTYRVPSRDGTNFNWSVQGGNIQGSSQTRSIQVIFNSFTSNPFVAIEMNDCTRGCLQRDTLWVNRTEPFIVEGPNTLCFGTAGQWQTNSSGTPVPSFWILRSPTGAVVDSTSTALADYTFSFSQAGRYTIQARPQSDIYCFPSLELSVLIRPELPDVGGIQGADTICPGNLYWYEGERATPPATVREWIAIEGTDSTFQSGNPIRQSWQAGVNKRLLTFFRAVETGCISELSEIPIEDITAISIAGPDTVCRGLEAVFHLGESLSDDVDWALSPNSGARITEHVGRDSVRILFSETGVVQLTASICGQTASKDVVIVSPPPIDLDALESIGCGIDFTPREVDGTLYDSIFWYENALLVSTSDRTELRRGQRNMLIVVDDFGCENRAAFSIPFFDFVRPRITSLNSPIFCNGGQTTLIHDIADTTDLDLAWYRDSTLIAENVDSVLVNITGYYRLEITQLSTGCVLESDRLLICESCDPNPDSTVVVCPLIGGGSPNDAQSCDPSLGNLITNVNYVDGRCDQIQLTTNAPDMIRGTAVWRVDLASGPRLYFGDTISFQATQNGQFTVYNSAFGINSMGDTTIYCPYPTLVEVPGTLDATSSLACLGDSTVFSPNIGLITSVSITNVEWNFGDGAPGSTSSEIMPRFRYASADSFSATIEIETSASCSLFDTLDVVVFPNPNASWGGDSTACTNERYEVEARGNAEFYDWRFGNPLPDSAQAIGLETGYSYDSAGIYEIQLTVEDLLGCTQDSSQLVQFNDYSGPDSILVQPELPACAGDWVDLSVSGPYSNLLWSTGSTDPQVIADRPGPYGVELIDNNGCRSELGPIDIEYEPAPDVHVRAYTLQGGGRYSGDTLEVCQGQAVEVRLISSAEEYTLSWSVGGNAPVIRYDGNTAAILNQGFYAFELTVTDTTSNCSASDAFYVLVHPQPNLPVLTTSQSPPYCAGEMVEISVDNPQANLNYIWSTGETGESIIANAAQPYSVRGVNAFGCEAESESIIVHPLPDVSFFPLGCYEECGGVDICLPIAEGSRLVEWYRNGTLENIPPNLSQVQIDSSGYYAGLIENAFGCQQQTDSIRFDIFYDAGIVNGFVFLDRNGDNIFNAGDSLVSNLRLRLFENMTLLDSTLTNGAGAYEFTDVPLGDYRIELDSSQLPINWRIVRGADSIQLTDCGEEVIIPAFILQDCPGIIDSVDLTACTGDSILIESVYYTTDTLFEIVEVIDGCPEATVYELQFFPGGDTTTVERLGCVGDTLNVRGEMFFSDTLIIQSLTNTFGCDSVVSIQLTFETEPTVDSLITLCSGDSVLIQGNWYDQDTSFSYLGQLPNISCDVRFEVEIQIQPAWNVTYSIEESCPSASDGSVAFTLGNRTLAGLRSLVFDGVDSLQLEWNNLAAGDYTVIMEDMAGCVYTETIAVTESEPLEITIPEVSIPCEGEAVQLSAQYISGDSTGLLLNWEDGGVGSNLAVNQPGDYVLRVMTVCEDFEITGRVRVEGADGGIQMYVPNVFSPNQDGINDVFQPTFSSPGLIGSYRLQIYDRWGSLLFESQDPAVGWNGRSRDQFLNPGVYVWRIEWTSAACAGSTFVEESGSISLLR